VLSRLDKNDWAFVQALRNYVGQWKEESFALDERTRGVRPKEEMARPYTAPDGSSWAGAYWPISFDPERSDRAAQREAESSVIGEYGGSFRTASTSRGRLKNRTSTGGQPLSTDFMSDLAKHVNDSIRDITHRDLVILFRKIKSDPELRNMIARIAGRDAVRALDAWTFRLGAKLPAQSFGDVGGIAAYLRRAQTNSAMGWKISVATLNMLGAFQAIPRNGILAQMKQVGITVGAGFPDLLRRHFVAMATGQKEQSERVLFVRKRSTMMAQRAQSFDRDMADARGDLLGRRPGTLLPKWFEDTLQILNIYTDQVVAIPTWMAAYESAANGEVAGVEGEQAAVDYADSVVRMTLSAGSTKDLTAMMASNNQWQRLYTMFMGWADAFYNQLFVEQFPGLASGKISRSRFAANMLFLWMMPYVIQAAFYGDLDKEDDEDWAEYWIGATVRGLIYPLQTIPFVRDAVSAVFTDYRPQTPYAAAIERSGRLAQSITADDPEAEKIAKNSFMLGAILTGVPVQIVAPVDYAVDYAQGEEDPAADPIDAAREALLRDTR
jgi:hypothetical protein